MESESVSENSVIYEDRELLRALNRIQLVSPLSLLIAIAVALGATFIADPAAGAIFHDVRTVVTGSRIVLYGFFIVQFLLLTAFTLLLNLTFSEDTMEVLAFGVGKKFSVLHLLIALWIILWTAGSFGAAAIVLAIAWITAIAVYLSLLAYPPSARRPLEALFVHLPSSSYIPFLGYLFLDNALIALGYYTKAGDALPGLPAGRLDDDATLHEWLIALVVLLGAILNAVVYLWRKDVVLPFAVSVISISQLKITEAKPPPVYLAILFGLTLNVVVFFAALVWHFKARKPISDDPETEPLIDV